MFMWGKASASFSSEGAVQFHDLLDHVVSTLNLLVVPVEETSYLVFNTLGVRAITWVGRIGATALGPALQGGTIL